MQQVQMFSRYAPVMLAAAAESDGNTASSAPLSGSCATRFISLPPHTATISASCAMVVMYTCAAM